MLILLSVLSRTFQFSIMDFLQNSLISAFWMFVLPWIKFNWLFFSEVIASHCQQHGIAFSEKSFYQNLGTVLSNSKDWDGNQTRRRRAQGASDNLIYEMEMRDVEHYLKYLRMSKKMFKKFLQKVHTKAVCSSGAYSSTHTITHLFKISCVRRLHGVTFILLPCKSEYDIENR